MVRPKKALGQHFLTDLGIARRIVESLPLTANMNILEVGPGKGVLTNFLQKLPSAHLKLAEIDAESVGFLKNTYGKDCPEILEEDFLKLPLDQVFAGQQIHIIGNFPYNISTQIVFHALENREFVPQLVGMFQKEVAQRICEKPGSKDYGILSVITQAFYTCEYLFSVKEGVFFPPPKVKSGVIRLTRKSNDLPEVRYDDLLKIVKLAFNQRRKQIRNSIKVMLPEGFDHPLLTKRPEQLHWKEFQTLLQLIVES